ncbi:hypothetical protein HAX54_034767 [Datura stramonium]|uniref:Uncharacterized protein n=1 Tax=Datura stramonium TaxID=4076 RepID=A0ABS8RLV3_DATST|nr:hypothetical protein [Datura stramonium]
MSETIYANGDHSGESTEGDAVEVEVSSQSSVISKTIINSKQILKADEEAKDQIYEEVDQENLISDGDIDNMIFKSFEAVKQPIKELKREFGGRSKASQKIDGKWQNVQGVQIGAPWHGIGTKRASAVRRPQGSDTTVARREAGETGLSRQWRARSLGTKIRHLAPRTSARWHLGSLAQSAGAHAGSFLL